MNQYGILGLRSCQWFTLELRELPEPAVALNPGDFKQIAQNTH
jgi:hypothetical protein